MKKIISIIILALAVLAATAQNQYEAVLSEIEANSLTLNALREQMEAQKLSNKTGIYLENPEVEFHYLWGSPTENGTRTDISVSQSFDFPTVYTHRSKISNLENSSAELMYKSERINLLLSAKQACIQLVYNNARAKEYATRLKNAEQIAEMYKKRLDRGDANIIETNKANLNLTTIKNEVASIETERASLLSELKRLNGGKEIVITNDDFFNAPLPLNFEEWYSSVEPQSPALQYISGQIELSDRQVKLNRAMSLPKFSAGYMSEKTTGEHYQGVMVGISIPLWENKNQVKQAKAQSRASQIVLEDTKVQFYNQLQLMYSNAFNLQRTISDYKESLVMHNNEALLKKALDAGEISLLNYLQELEYYYDATDKMLEAERDFQVILSELEAVTL